MTIPTKDQAVAYVAKKEWQWNGRSSDLVFARPDRDNEGMMIVKTAYAEWGVWFQPDGSLYGEC